MAAKKTTEEKVLTVDIKPIKQERFNLTIVGDSPLIVHKWSEKAKKMILDTQTKKAKAPKTKKNPLRDYAESLYWIDEKGNQIADPTVNDFETDEDMAKEYERIQKIAEQSHFGFPACALDAAFQQGAIPKKTTAKGAFHIEEELVEIKGVPTIREDMVRVGGISKVADIRYRGEFHDWTATLTISYNPDVITASQIANMINLGGFCNGVGEWRPSKNGEFGRFHVKEG